uniref:Uncharacterized protein n=1 Tax=Setaria viridis TaxID=4556 RepID=A0A4U6SP42_SETVI|nr:hypothetical protein SEVIR_9G021050v2 [Setaria viridis]
MLVLLLVISQLSFCKSSTYNSCSISPILSISG